MASTTSPDIGAPVVVTFARPEESGPFRRRIAGLRKTNCGALPAFRGRSGKADVVIIHTGIGPEAASRAIRSVLEVEKPRLLICAGFGGGLDPALRVGETIAVDFSSGVILSSSDPLETPAQKAAMFRKTGARIVDMETATVAAACSSAGVPLIAVRAVSDCADESLPVPFGAWFDAARQRARPFALVGYLLRKPSRALPFARFVSRLPRVSAALARAIEDVLSKHAAGG